MLKLGDPQAARPLFAEAILLARDLSNPLEIGLSLGSFSGLSEAEGQLAKAVCQGSAALRLDGSVGTVIPKGPRVWLEEVIRASSAAIGPAAAPEAWQAGQTMSPEALIADALAG
jgi:hypothetical protein